MSRVDLVRHRDACGAPSGQAVKARVGREGAVVLRCRDCRAIAVIGADHADPPQEGEIRRWHLPCVACETDIAPPNGRPRIPLCPTCRETRARRAAAERNARIESRDARARFRRAP